MEKADALKINQQLADGIDPHTGKAFGKQLIVSVRSEIKKDKL